MQTIKSYDDGNKAFVKPCDTNAISTSPLDPLRLQIVKSALHNSTLSLTPNISVHNHSRIQLKHTHMLLFNSFIVYVCEE